jgi:hypothetical protein
MIETRINELKEAIRCYTPREWHYRTGLESLDSLQKTLELNEFILELIRQDIPVTFFKGLLEPVVARDYFYSSTIARA